MSEFPKLPRKPLGYDPAAVDRLISERDSMLGLAEHRIRQAEARLAELEEQIRSRDQLLAQVRDEMEARALASSQMEDDQAAPPAEEEPPPLTPKFMTEELSKIVVAAEESTSQIIERAWAATRDQIIEADRLWRDVQFEAVRFASWREDAEVTVQSVKASIQAARAKIEDVPQRVQEALAPAVEAMVEVDTGMARFAAASSLPLMVAPTGLETAHAEAHGRGAEPEQEVGGEPDIDEYARPGDPGDPAGLWVDESYLSEDDELEGLPVNRPSDTDGDGEEAESPRADALEDETIDPSAANIWRGSA
jgi:hypothetical protein